MALRQASRLLLVILTAWSLCGFAVLLEVDSFSNPSELLVSSAHAGDPDEFSDGNEKPDPGDDASDENEGLILEFINWVEDTIRDLF